VLNAPLPAFRYGLKQHRPGGDRGFIYQISTGVFSVAAPKFFGCPGTARAPEFRLGAPSEYCAFLAHFGPLPPLGHSRGQPFPTGARAPRLASASRRHWVFWILGATQ